MQADEEGGSYDMAGLDVAGEGQLGSWTQKRRTQMNQMEAILQTAGWRQFHDSRSETYISTEGVQPERNLSMSKWKELVSQEKNKCIANRSKGGGMDTNYPQESDLDIQSRIVNDARVVPAS